MAMSERWSDEDFMPVMEAARRQAPPFLVSLFIAAITLFVACGLTWAWLATLDEVTVGEGKVIPSRKLQVVQNLEGGIVKEVLVREGDIVAEEQILLRIDDTGFAANFGEARVKALNLEAAIARLTSEVEGAPLSFPAHLMAERPDFAATERANLEARRASQQAELSTLRQQLSQRESELVELRNRLFKLDRSYKLLVEEYNATAPLLDTGSVAKIEVLRLERQVSEMRGDLEGTRLAIPRAGAAIEEIRNRIHEREALHRSEAFRELAQRRAELAAVNQAIGAMRDRVERTDVRSPVRGIVQQIKVRTLGGVVRPGESLVEIVPIDDTLLVEARVRPADIAFIHPDQPATVKLSAYDFSIYGGLTGKVEKISADTVADEKTGEPFYLVQVRTEGTQLQDGERNMAIIPGMVASVDILTGKKSVLDYLLKPFLKAKERALRER